MSDVQPVVTDLKQPYSAKEETRGHYTYRTQDYNRLRNLNRIRILSNLPFTSSTN